MNEEDMESKKIELRCFDCGKTLEETLQNRDESGLYKFIFPCSCHTVKIAEAYKILSDVNNFGADNYERRKKIEKWLKGFVN